MEALAEILKEKKKKRKKTNVVSQLYERHESL